MKRFLFLFIVFYFLFFIFYSSPTIHANDRFAVCDLCGYCPPNNPPSTWESCRACLYPNAAKNHSLKETLKINPTENIPPTPYPGRWHTMLGCVSTTLGSFQQEGAAGGVVQILLNIIFGIAGGISLLFLIYGAFVILTSQANPERLIFGKRIIYGAVIGLIFTLSVVFLVNFLASRVLRIPGFGE